MKKNLKNCPALATVCCVKGALTGLKIISAFYWDLCQMLLKEVKFGYLSKEIVLEHCRWYPFCWMKRKINRDRRRQITGQTWPWVRATPSSPVSPYSKVSTKSLPRTGLLSLDLHVHWKCTGGLAIFGEYLFLDFTYELIHKINVSLKCNFLKYIVLIESLSTNVGTWKCYFHLILENCCPRILMKPH